MPDEAEVVFERAAELFAMLAAPVRLQILSELCDGERNVSHLLERIACTQPNLSQHLSLLYRMGVLTRRRDGAQVHYRLADASLGGVCRTICSTIVAETAVSKEVQ